VVTNEEGVVVTKSTQHDDSRGWWESRRISVAGDDTTGAEVQANDEANDGGKDGGEGAGVITTARTAATATAPSFAMARKQSTTPTTAAITTTPTPTPTTPSVMVSLSEVQRMLQPQAPREWVGYRGMRNAEGEADGHGECRSREGELYIGQWREGSMVGYGEYFFVSGNRYQVEILIDGYTHRRIYS
jgi:hypothetical protein